MVRPQGHSPAHRNVGTSLHPTWTTLREPKGARGGIGVRSEPALQCCETGLESQPLSLLLCCDRGSRDSATSPPRRRRPGSLRLSTRPIADRLAALQAAGTLDPRIDPTVAAKAFEAMQSGVIAWWLEDPARAKRSAVHETLVRLHPALATRRSDGSAVGAESAQHLKGGVDQHAGTGPQRR